MAAAGVPVLPGSTRTPSPTPTSRSWSRRRQAAAAAGCGRSATAGRPARRWPAPRRGRHRLRRPDRLLRALLEAGQHVEVQVLADGTARCGSLGERECSLQRRHQKVIEEAPSPASTTASGRDLRRGRPRPRLPPIGYRGAGTVEFLADPAGEFWFLEMNTRLQVEHPVTECRLRRRPRRPAARRRPGLALPPRAAGSAGHAIEARLYAEDPRDDWRPQTGR